MICKENAKFPYPVLSNYSNGYKENEFIFDALLKENAENYGFDITFEIKSNFITNLIEKGKAELLLVVQSRDNKYFSVEAYNQTIEIPKRRVSLSRRTILQLLVMTKEDISFEQNSDLNSFYYKFKDDIRVKKHSVLAFSNTVIFEGNMNKPLELFEKRVDPNLKSDIAIELGSETIIVVYRDEDFQFINLRMSNALNNPYIYMGLQKALYQFIDNHSKDEDGIYLDEIDVPANELEIKLYQLMRSKMIYELNYENIDEVIYMITDKIINKYAGAVRGLALNGD